MYCTIIDSDMKPKTYRMDEKSTSREEAERINNEVINRLMSKYNSAKDE